MDALPYLVLDQNVLRVDRLLQPAIAEARRTGAKLMLTDATLIETMKNDRWETTARDSFKILAKVPELVTIGHSVPDLFRTEFDIGMPAFSQLENTDYAGSIRALLVEIQVGHGPILDYMRSRIANAQVNILPQYLNGEDNKRRLGKYVDALKEAFRDERSKLKDPAARRTLVADPRWSSVMARQLKSAGAKAPAMIAHQRSLVAHSLLATTLVALRWYRDGGLETAKEAIITNELMDAEYATIASFCQNFISQDGRALGLWEDLVEIAKLRSQLSWNKAFDE